VVVGSRLDPLRRDTPVLAVQRGRALGLEAIRDRSQRARVRIDVGAAPAVEAVQTPAAVALRVLAAALLTGRHAHSSSVCETRLARKSARYHWPAVGPSLAASSTCSSISAATTGESGRSDASGNGLGTFLAPGAMGAPLASSSFWSDASARHATFVLCSTPSSSTVPRCRRWRTSASASSPDFARSQCSGASPLCCTLPLADSAATATRALGKDASSPGAIWVGLRCCGSDVTCCL